MVEVEVDIILQEMEERMEVEVVERPLLILTMEEEGNMEGMGVVKD